MPAAAPLVLRCLLKGDSTITFKITVPINSDIDDLKELILEKELGNETHILARELNLLRVNLGLPASDDEDSLKSIKVKEGDEGVERLVAWKSVLTYWPVQPPTNRLHVIILMPIPGYTISPSSSNQSNISQPAQSNTGKHCHSPNPSDSFKSTRVNIRPKDLWLLELHSKIWGRLDLRPELIHKVTITAAHYIELQKRLMELHPGRDLPDYQAGRVQALKLDVLQSFNALLHPTPIVPNHPNGDDDDVGNGLDDELCQLFPTTIQYLDLSSLKLEKRPRRIPLPLLIRQEYGLISSLLDELPKDSAGSAIISGQPGIGKTAYLHLQMIDKMMAGQPFLYQTTKGDVYHVSKDISRIGFWSSEEDSEIVAFIDADAGSYTVNDILIDPFIRIIAASSPKGTEQNWLKQNDTNSFVTKYAAALWSPTEYFLTGIFLHPRDLTHARLKESASYLGFNPRRSFKASFSAQSLLHHQMDIEHEIRSISSTVNISSILHETYTSRGLSHLIFELSPEDDVRLLGRARVGAVSMWALDMLLGKYEARQSDAAAEFYDSIAGISSAASLRGRIMERQVLKYFDSLNNPEIFEIRSLMDSSIIEWTYPGPAKRTTFQSQSFTPALQSAVDSKEPLHLVPLDLNFPAVDSVVYDPDAVLVGVQVTIRDLHPIAASGLKHIQGFLKRHTCLAHLRPLILGNHWRLIFVVPETAAASFGLQAFEGDTGTQEWARKIDQYVLGIPEDSLWGRSGYDSMDL